MTLPKLIRGPLLGRGGRFEYWIATVLAVGLVLALMLQNTPRLQAILPLTALFVWVLAAARRLRDIGWPAWISLWPVAVLLAMAVVSAFSPPDVSMLWLPQAFSVLPLVWLVFAVLVGAWKPRPAPVPDAERRAEVFG